MIPQLYNCAFPRQVHTHTESFSEVRFCPSLRGRVAPEAISHFVIVGTSSLRTPQAVTCRTANVNEQGEADCARGSSLTPCSVTWPRWARGL